MQGHSSDSTGSDSTGDKELHESTQDSGSPEEIRAKTLKACSPLVQRLAAGLKC